MSVTSRELDYSKIMVNHSSYQYGMVKPQTSAGVDRVIDSGGNETIFEIPVKGLNLDETILYYTLYKANVANRKTIHYADCLPEIRQIQLYDRNGLMMVDLLHSNLYTNSVMRQETEYEKIKQNSKARSRYVFTDDADETSVKRRIDNVYEGLFLPNAELTGVDANANTATFRNVKFVPLATNNDALGVIPSLDTPCYEISSSVAVNKPIEIKKRLRLGDFFKNTMFEYNKTLYFGDTIYLKIIWENVDKVIYQVSNTTTYANLESSTNYTIKGDLTLYLAEEKNPIIQDSLRKQYNSGYTITIPYVYSNIYSSSASSTHSIITRYNPSHGKYLKKIYWVPFYGTDTLINAYNHENRSCNNITSFYTLVDNNRTNPYNYDCLKIEDYMIKSKKLKGSGITSIQDYYDNFCWVEDFTDNYELYKAEMLGNKDNKVDGMKIDHEIIYDVECNTLNTRAFKHMVFAVVLRDLYIGPDGIKWV